MKFKSKLCMLLLSVFVLVTIMGTISISAKGSNVSMKVEPISVNVGETVVVEIANADVTVESLGVILSFDTDLLKCVSMTGVDGDEYFGIYYSGRKGAATWADAQVADTVEETNNDGKYSFGWMTTKDTLVFEGTIVTLTFEAIGTGDAVISLEERTTGADAFTGEVTSATVTITSSTPTCDHVDTDKTYVSNGDNTTHTITCVCGEVIDTQKACVGGEATCVAKAVCDFCNTSYGDINADNHQGVFGDNSYVPNNNGTHALWKHCYGCNEDVEVIEPSIPCEDNDGDKKCDYCNVVIPCKHTETKAVSNNDGTHNVVCTNEACNGYVVTPNETCDFTNNHTCVCGQVEKFTLSVYVSATDTTVYLTVPYGANILEVLAKAELNAEIPALGTEIRVKNDGFNGIRIPSGYSYQGEDEHMIGVPTDLTMPGEILEVNQDCFDDGWYISDLDDDGVHESYEFIRYDVESYGYLTEGWHYIEENYDDVQGGAWYYFYEGTGEYENWFFRAEGLTRVPYPTEPIDGKTYGPNAEDKAYWEANPDTSMYSDAETAVFVFDEDGKFLSDKNGMIEDGNITRYAINGCIPWHVGMVEIEGEYYYFGADKSADARGNSMSLGYTWVTRDTTGDFSEINEKGKHYFFGFSGENEGQLVKRETGIYSNTEKVLENEQLVDKIVFYYIVDYERVYGAGVVKMNENDETFYIYVRSNGLLATGKYWPTVRNDFLESGEYDWGTDGRLYLENQNAE